MDLLRCEIAEDGPRPGFKAIGVASFQGHTEYLAIEERFLVQRDDGYYLPVNFVGKDRVHKTVLVQLPIEADSGANRIWVREGQLVEEHEVVA